MLGNSYKDLVAFFVSIQCILAPLLSTEEPNRDEEISYGLLYSSQRTQIIPLVQHFNHSHIKLRIAMMNRQPTKQVQFWTYALFLP